MYKDIRSKKRKNRIKYNKNNLFIYRQLHFFDLDGVLAHPREKITKENIKRIKNINKCVNARIYIVSGSTFEMIMEQIPENIRVYFTGIFACSGNEYYMRTDEEGTFRRVYTTEFNFPTRNKLYTFFQEKIKQKQYKNQYKDLINERPGMVNFSMLGRDAPFEERIEYFKWDQENKERESIVEELKQKFGNYIDVSIGGQISIDIFLKDKNKFQALKYIKNFYNELDNNIVPDKKVVNHFIFYGDKLNEGGNDYCVLEGLRKEKWDKWTVVGFNTETLNFELGKMYGTMLYSLNGNHKPRGLERSLYFASLDVLALWKKYNYRRKKKKKQRKPFSFKIKPKVVSNENT